MRPLTEFRYAARVLRKNPGFTLIAALTLALGIGANTALFSIVNHILLKPLPYPAPDRMVLLWMRGIQRPDDSTIASMPNFKDWRSMSAGFEAMAAFERQSYNLSGTDEPEQVPGIRASAAIFSVIGTQPALGRAFTEAEEELGRDKVAVISDSLWRRRYGGDPAIAGRAIRVNGEMRTVVGVMPPRVHFPGEAFHLLVPIAFNEEDRGRGSQSFWVAGRLKPNVTMAQAAAEMNVIGRRLEHFPGNSGWTVGVQRMSEFGMDNLQSTFFALAGAVGFVLLIACANIANLMLARAGARQREFAVRLSLGATRLRLMRQLMSESLVLAALGGGAGLLLAPWLMTGFLRIAPGDLTSFPFRTVTTAAIDSNILAFAAAATVLTGLLFGALPAWTAGRAPLSDSLKESGGRGATATRGRAREVLVASEVALAMIVTTGAGLLIASVSRLLTVDPGLNPDHVLTMQVSLPQPDFYGPPERPRFCMDLEDRVSRIPGMLSVSASSHLPFSGANAGRSLTIEGRPVSAEGSGPGASYRLVCPGYFRVMGIPVRSGREFSHSDTVPAPQVVILNETAARRFYPGEEPVGKRLKLGGPKSTGPWMTVVAVVGDVRHFGLDQRAEPEMFRPYSQSVWPAMTIVARTQSKPESYATAIRKAISEIDRELPVSQIQTMEQWVDSSLGGRRFPMRLLSAFGALALLLAAVGVFGVTSWIVTARTREIGIRIALGAYTGDVVRMVLGRGMLPVFIGIAVGVAGSLAVTRTLSDLLYGVKPTDPSVLTTVGALLAGVAALACYLPTRRATKVDPVVALRYE